MRLSTAFRVTDPNAISLAPRGARPATTSGVIVPRSDWIAHADTGCPSTSTPRMQRPRVPRLRACARPWSLRSAHIAPRWVPTSVFTSNVQPYNRGVSCRCARLAANTSTAVIPARPNTAPRYAERIGTDVSPRPAWSAIRSPLVAVGGIPARAAASTTGDVRRLGAPRSAAPRARRRHAADERDDHDRDQNCGHTERAPTSRRADRHRDRPGERRRAGTAATPRWRRLRRAARHRSLR